MLIKLTEEQIEHLQIFLNRIKYKGTTEVIACSNILLALQTEIKLDDKLDVK